MMLTENRVRKIVREEIKNVLDEVGEYKQYEPKDIDHHAFVSKQIGNVLKATEEATGELRNRKKQHDSPYMLKKVLQLYEKLLESFETSGKLEYF